MIHWPVYKWYVQSRGRAFYWSVYGLWFNSTLRLYIWFLTFLRKTRCNLSQIHYIFAYKEHTHCISRMYIRTIDQQLSFSENSRNMKSWIIFRLKLNEHLIFADNKLSSIIVYIGQISSCIKLPRGPNNIISVDQTLNCSVWDLLLSTLALTILVTWVIVRLELLSIFMYTSWQCIRSAKGTHLQIIVIPISIGGNKRTNYIFIVCHKSLAQFLWKKVQKVCQLVLWFTTSVL